MHSSCQHPFHLGCRAGAAPSAGAEPLAPASADPPGGVEPTPGLRPGSARTRLSRFFSLAVRRAICGTARDACEAAAARARTSTDRSAAPHPRATGSDGAKGADMIMRKQSKPLHTIQGGSGLTPLPGC
jgi:hypothetical protein